MRDDGRPVLFVMNMQQGFAQPDDMQAPHLTRTRNAIYDFVEAARETGVRIVWNFRDSTKDASTSFVTSDFAKAKAALTQRSDAPLADVPAAEGDMFWVRPMLQTLDEKMFDDQLAAMGISPKTAMAGCGFYLDEPVRDGAYLWAHEMQDKHRPIILQDLTDNPVPFAKDAAAQANISFLKRVSPAIGWMNSADWLAIMTEDNAPDPALAVSGFAREEKFSLSSWMNRMLDEGPLPPKLTRNLQQIADLVF